MATCAGPAFAAPVPTPVRFGEPSERFPKHWTVMTWVPGDPLDPGSISRDAHAADTLASFLRALHVEAPAEAPTATDRGAHPRNCTDGFENFFQAVAPDDIAADVRAVWDDAVAAQAWECPPVVGWPGGVAPPGSHRSGRDSLPSPGSCHLRWPEVAGVAPVGEQVRVSVGDPVPAGLGLLEPT
jgi:hypothetical protein